MSKLKRTPKKPRTPRVKSTPTPSDGASTGDFVIGEVQSAKELKLLGRGGREGNYLGLIEKAGTLKVGESFTVSIPAGLDPAVFQDRLSAAVMRNKESRLSGKRISVRRVDGDKSIAFIALAPSKD